MDNFVKEKLIQWGFDSFIERFEKAGIDQEIFNEIDDSMLDELFDKSSECGFRRKMKIRLDQFKYSDISISATPSSFGSNISVIEEFILPVTDSDSIMTSTPLPTPDQRISIGIRSRTLSVKELLDKTHRGLLIMKEYEKTMKLNTQLINSLIVEHEFESTNNYRITTERLLEIAKELAEIFTFENKTVKEVQELFFYPYRKATKTSKAINAGGTLYDKYLNSRKILIKFGVISKNQILQEDMTYIFYDTDAAGQESLLDWIRKNDSPQQEVEKIWAETFARRLFEKDYKNHFLFYKCLRSSFGHILWSIDFNLLYPDLENFTDTWNSLSDLIIEYARDKKKLTTTDLVLIEKNKQYIVALLCLPRILGKCTRKRKSSESANSFGATTQDIVDSFILTSRSLQDFEIFREVRTRSSVETKCPIGPFVTFIGDLKNDGKVNDDQEATNVHVFVTVNSIDYRITSNRILDAVDYCYKSFSTLNIDFPIECRPVWTFLRVYLYKNDVQNSKPYRIVDSFIDELNAKRNSP